jgi:integration host factor subunit beta
MSINKKELIEIIANEQDQLPYKDIELSVKTIIESMIDSLTKGKRIEIRGFGSFSLRYRKSRIGRNPKSGESVNIDERYVPHFKPGKDLKERVKTS